MATDGSVAVHRHSRLSTRTRECIGFSNKDLLRATKATSVLHRFGQILSNNQGSAETYEQSEPVGSIDYFISHNWSTKRSKKFLALAVHFNLWPAVCAAVVTCALAASLTVGGFFPVREFRWKERVFRQGMACHCLGSIAFFVTLLLWHELGARLQKPITVFLDKTCIHQTDVTLKKQGIRSLAAFLANSKSLLIVYSDLYLQKLWTVYELASNLVLHPGGPVIVVPVFLPELVLRGILFWLVFTTIHLTMSLEVIWDFVDNSTLSHYLDVGVTLGLMLPASAALMVTQRKWARKRADIQRLVENFSITRAACFCEDDRPVVQGNIASFMRDLELVPADATEAAALAAFDQLVREEVPHALATSFGRAGIPYRYAVTIFMAQSLRIWDQITPMVRGLLQVDDFCIDASFHLTMHFALLPLGIAAFEIAVSHCLDEGVRPALVLIVSFFAIFALFCALWLSFDMVANMAKDSRLSLPLYLSYLLVLCCLARLAFRPLAAKPVQRSSLAELKRSGTPDLAESLASSMRSIVRSFVASASTSTSTLGEAPVASEGAVVREELRPSPAPGAMVKGSEAAELQTRMVGPSAVVAKVPDVEGVPGRGASLARVQGGLDDVDDTRPLLAAPRPLAVRWEGHVLLAGSGPRYSPPRLQLVAQASASGGAPPPYARSAYSAPATWPGAPTRPGNGALQGSAPVLHATPAPWTIASPKGKVAWLAASGLRGAPQVVQPGARASFRLPPELASSQRR